MDYLEYLGRRLVWLVVSLVVVIVVKRPRILKRLAIVSDVTIGKNPLLYLYHITRLSRELMSSYQRKKNKLRAATATYNHSLNNLKVCKKVT